MSPPIRDGSGNSIGSVRLGDGTEISEIRTGAGDVLFSASETPNSAIHHWPMSAGTGTTISDQIGTSDFSLNGASWTTGTFVDSQATVYDGDDDGASATVDVDSLSQVTLLITVRIETVNQGDSYIWSWDDGGFGLFQFRYNRNGNNRLSFQVGDGGTTLSLTSSIQVSDTTSKYRLVGIYEENNNIEFHINNSQEGSTGIGTKGPQGDGTYFARSGSGSKRGDITVDNAIMCDSALSDTEITDDYNIQPWS